MESLRRSPRGDSIAARFGGWLRALAAAGLISDNAAACLRIGHGRSFTDAELDDALARFALEANGKPTSGAYQRWRDCTMNREEATHLPGSSALANRLGGWPNAAQRIRKHRTNNDVMNDRPSAAAHVIADLVPALDHRTCRQLRAMLADELATHEPLSPSTHSLIGLTTVIAARDRVPSVIEYEHAQQQHPGWPHPSTLIRRYGSWLHAVNAAAHFMSDKPKRARPPRVTATSQTRTDCVNAILRCQLAIGDWPGSSEYSRWRNIEADLRRRTGDNTNIPPDFNAIHRHFGTWAAALRLARASSPAPD